MLALIGNSRAEVDAGGDAWLYHHMPDRRQKTHVVYPDRGAMVVTQGNRIAISRRAYGHLEQARFERQ